jgi:hypothetical protein
MNAKKVSCYLVIGMLSLALMGCAHVAAFGEVCLDASILQKLPAWASIVSEAVGKEFCVKASVGELNTPKAPPPAPATGK